MCDLVSVAYDVVTFSLVVPCLAVSDSPVRATNIGELALHCALLRHLTGTALGSLIHLNRVCIPFR